MDIKSEDSIQNKIVIILVYGSFVIFTGFCIKT